MKPNLQMLKPPITSALRVCLLEAFTHTNSISSPKRHITELIRLHAISCCGDDIATAVLISPRGIIASLISDLTKTLAPASCVPPVAVARCLRELSLVWQLAHEFGGSVVPSISEQLTVQLFSTLLKKLDSISSGEFSTWTKLLQSIVKLSIFVLAENYNNSSAACSTASSLLISLLSHPKSNISCVTRDLLCTALVCLFFGNQRIMENFCDPSPSTQQQSTSTDQNEKDNTRRDSIEEDDEDEDTQTLEGSVSGAKPKNTDSKRLRRIRRPRFVPKRQAGLIPENSGESEEGSLEEIGRNLNEILQFITSTANLQQEDNENVEGHDNDGFGQESRRDRREHRRRLARYLSLREAVEELRRDFGSRHSGRVLSAVVFDANDPIVSLRLLS